MMGYFRFGLNYYLVDIVKIFRMNNFLRIYLQVQIKKSKIYSNLIYKIRTLQLRNAYHS